MLEKLVNTMRDVIDLKRNEPKAAEAALVKDAAIVTAAGYHDTPDREEIDDDPADATQAVVEMGAEISEEEITRVTTDVVKALKTVYDPEIPVDIYELGLIYKVDFDNSRNLKVDMTLTAPGCPVAGEMPGWVEGALRTVDGVNDVFVEMTFDPPWTPEKMSDEARLELGWM